MYLACISKHNLNREKQVIILMISKGENYGNVIHYKKLSALLKRVTPKNYGDFCCLNCLHSFRTKNKSESHKKKCENKYFCNVIMSTEVTKLLEINQCKKSDKAPLLFIQILNI